MVLTSDGGRGSTTLCGRVDEVGGLDGGRGWLRWGLARAWRRGDGRGWCVRGCPASGAASVGATPCRDLVSPDRTGHWLPPLSRGAAGRRPAARAGMRGCGPLPCPGSLQSCGLVRSRWAAVAAVLPGYGPPPAGCVVGLCGLAGRCCFPAWWWCLRVVASGSCLERDAGAAAPGGGLLGGLSGGSPGSGGGCVSRSCGRLGVRLREALVSSPSRLRRCPVLVLEFLATPR